MAQLAPNKASGVAQLAPKRTVHHHSSPSPQLCQYHRHDQWRITIIHLLLLIFVNIIVIITIQWRFTIIKAIIIIKADPSSQRYRED